MVKEGDDMMKLSCVKKCRILEFLANLKCVNYFSVDTYGGEQDKCGCRLRNEPALRVAQD
jgi:hypothetical protein